MMKKQLIKEIIAEIKEEEKSAVPKLSNLSLKRRKKLKKRERKKARIAAIKESNKSKAKLQKQKKKILGKQGVLKTEAADTEINGGNIDAIENSDASEKRKNDILPKHKPLQALKAAALKNNDKNDASDSNINVDDKIQDDVNVQMNIGMNNNIDADSNVNNEIENSNIADAEEVEKNKKTFSPILSKVLRREKKNLTFKEWEMKKIEEMGINKEAEFFMRMCLTKEEKQSGDFFEEKDLKRRKKERVDFRNFYKARIKDLKESYKVAKKKRRSKIKLALAMIKAEQKTRMKDVNKPKLEKKPWLSSQERKEEILRHQLQSRGSSSGVSDPGDSSIHGVAGGILEAEMLPLAKVPDTRWDRLARPLRPLKKRKPSTNMDEADILNISPRKDTVKFTKKNVEFMALTEDEKLSLIDIIPRKIFTAKQYKNELQKQRPKRRTRVNGTGDKMGKVRASVIGRRVMDYSGVFPVVSTNRKEPIKIDPYAYYMENNQPKNDKMLIQNNFPGPKDGVEAKAWEMYGQKYFTADKLERRLMRLRARVQHDREARKINLQWINDSLNNLKLYKKDLCYDDCEKAYLAFQEVNKYLDIQSYGLKAMIDEDVKENLGELKVILNNAKGDKIEINAAINEAEKYLIVEFEKGHHALQLNFKDVQSHVNKIIEKFNKVHYIQTKTQYNDAIKYHDAGEAHRLEINVALARDEIQARARLAEIDAWKEEMGKTYKEMRSIPYVDKRKLKELPPQECWVCKAPLTFKPKTAEFTFCTECTNFNENKRNKKKIYATTDKRKQQAIKNLHTGVDMACKKIGKAVLNGEIIHVNTFANIKRLERLSEIPTSPQSPGPGWYDNLDVRVLTNPSGGNGPRKFSLAAPGTLEKHLKEMKFQERLKSYGWSNKLKNRITKIREIEKESLKIVNDINENEQSSVGVVDDSDDEEEVEGTSL